MTGLPGHVSCTQWNVLVTVPVVALGYLQ